MISIDLELARRRKGWCRDCELPFGLVERAEWPDSNTCVECLARIPAKLRGEEIFSEVSRVESEIWDLTRQIDDLERERDDYESRLMRLQKELEQVRRVAKMEVR